MQVKNEGETAGRVDLPAQASPDKNDPSEIGILSKSMEQNLITNSALIKEADLLINKKENVTEIEK